ncbi:MAG: signal peptide peptidase SppA [Syntrophales bacterium]|nr:signal peptide peptidase SppA [Syntrophales bacterium]
MRKHPILFGLLLLVAIGLLFFLAAQAILSIAGDGVSRPGRAKVAVVKVEGMITDSRDVVELLDTYEKARDVKAVVIRIDSPGGGVVPSQEIYDKILKVRNQKKVVVSMGIVAASGGYYIASAADMIVANPGTITGGIGVLMQFPQFHELMDRVGLRSTVIKSGTYKDTGSFFRDMTEDEFRVLQAVVDDIHEQFVEAVAANRPIPPDKLLEISESRIFTGRQALEEGLVDKLGGLDDAIALAASLAGIVGEPYVVYPKKRAGFLRYLISEMASGLYQVLMKGGTGISYLYREDVIFGK